MANLNKVMLIGRLGQDPEIRYTQSGSSVANVTICLLYTSPSPRDRQKSRMPSSA